MAEVDKKYNILVLSNETKVINKLYMIFESSKYNFELTRNPLEAINKIKLENYDLVIINFIFPKELLELIVRKIRVIDSFIYILLLNTNYNQKNALDIIKNYDVQATFNLDDDFTKLAILVDLIINSIYEFMRINLQLDNYDSAHKSPYLSTVKILRNIVEYKDTYTIRHSFRVSKYSLLIGKYMKLSRSNLKTLKLGGMFHDIGKISTPNSILLKNSSLTNNEYLQIKAHPLIGSHILFPAKMYSKIIPIIKFHHERYDGNGYPSKLKGEAIPLFARITTIADTFDAMTSKRNYRDALPLETVVNEFERCKGTQFDPKLTDIFLDIIKNHYDEIEEIQKKYK